MWHLDQISGGTKYDKSDKIAQGIFWLLDCLEKDIKKFEYSECKNHKINNVTFGQGSDLDSIAVLVILQFIASLMFSQP